MAGPGEIADKMAKLLRVACSNGPDGEKLAAVGRLSAIALAHDLDWDQVLTNGGAELTQEQMECLYTAGYERGLEDGKSSGAPRPPDWSPTATPPGRRTIPYAIAVIDAAADCEAQGGLTAFEEQFTASLGERLACYGSRSFISPKQWAVLESLAEKLERCGYLDWP